MLRTFTALFALTLAACAAAVGSPGTPSGADDTGLFAHNDYADMDAWLCHPDKADDACATDLTATQINPDGSTEIVPFQAASDPAFDCFYIYPTVSRDQTPNSDMTPGPEEISAIKNQFARYGAACRLFAPMYRQRTLKDLQSNLLTGNTDADLAMRYGDIADSWQTYMRDHNDGRGVVLIGHSQGARMVFDLLEFAILDSPDYAQLIAAHSIGLTKPVDPVSGGFKTMALCASATDTGCLVSYASFRSTVPPPSTSFFGKASDQGRAICTNPAQLAGGSATLDAFIPARRANGRRVRDFGAEVDTPFVTLPGLLTASCQSNDSHDWLEVTVHGDPADPRTDEIGGDVIMGRRIVAGWGLHRVDINLAMGNLVSLAETQGAAWIAAHPDE